MLFHMHIKVKVNVLIIFFIEHEMVCYLNNKIFIFNLFLFLFVLDNVKCLEAYPTLHKVPNNPNGLFYSDHLAIHAILEIDQNVPKKQIKPLEDVEIADEKTREILSSACIIVEQGIQRIQRERVFFGLCLFILIFILFSFNGNPLLNSHLFATFTILKNLICIIGIAICVWFICLGKPVERNALSSIENAMRIRLRAAHFSY